ncbi:MAG: hypothetical protein K0Q73_1685 [Paenibacillus sp.]|jgi:hypothetical protein|nr:hypothetical protein [Paenibacillus sp.]
MSEFTSGQLLLASHKEAIRKHAIPGSLLKVLDEKWVAFLTGEDNYIDFHEAPAFIYQLSIDAPVLYFCNYGDHFWGYRIFSEGKEVASLRISYEFDEELIMKIFEERYPDNDLYELFTTDYHNEINKYIEVNGLQEKAFNDLFDECNVTAFKLFNLTDEQIDNLTSILNPNYFREQDNIFNLVDEFKEIVGIDEMSWIRYERVEEDEDYEERF